MADSDTPTGISAAHDRLNAVSCVLFDLDGTLIDTVALILSSFRHATRAVLGEELPDEVLLANVGMPLAQQMRVMSPEHADELLRTYREHNSTHHDDMVREYPGTEEVLEELLGAGYVLGVVTSKGTAMTTRGLERFGLGRYFSAVVTADDVGAHKPDPTPVNRAAELLGLVAESCAYVGDSPHDMSSALAAGAIAIAALWGAFPPEQVLAPGPDFALSSIRELPGLLAGESVKPVGRRGRRTS